MSIKVQAVFECDGCGEESSPVPVCQADIEENGVYALLPDDWGRSFGMTECPDCKGGK